MRDEIIAFSVERIAYSKNKDIFYPFLSAIPRRFRGRRYPLYAKDGFTLVEVLLAVSILAFGLCSILITYMNMIVLSDLSRDFTKASNGLQLKLEEIKRTSFTGLSALNGIRFELNGFSSSDAEGIVEVQDATYSDLKRVRIVVSFRSHNRIIGEDANLNGVLNAGEDSNGNGRLDSPLELVSLIAK